MRNYTNRRRKEREFQEGEHGISEDSAIQAHFLELAQVIEVAF
jgi:hypothetical protein